MKNYKSGYNFYMALCAAPTKEKRLELIKNCENINVQGDRGETALIWATHIGNEEIARLLIENGAKLDLPDKKGMTALMHAERNNRKEIINFLKLKEKANVENTVNKPWYSTPKQTILYLYNKVKGIIR